jgi:CubicO group peptidase (beta-lactamase class C family)
MAAMTTLRPDPLRRALLAGASSVLLAAPFARAASWPDAIAESLPGLNDALASGAQVAALRAVAVARSGQLIAEQFYNGATAGSLWRINSATKSVCSVLVGIALAQGKLRDLSQTVGELLPEAAAANPGSAVIGVTLRQVLTGTTGLAYDWSTQTRALAVAPDPVRFAFALPRDTAPAGSWSYNDAAVGLLAPILERAHGLPLADIARRDLGGPLGIEQVDWSRDRTGRPIAYGGMRLQTRDLLKLAWMMADGGRWQGKQLVPADWVTESTRPQVAGAWPNPPIEERSGYGHLWFTGRYKGVPVAWAWGYGAQFALLAPSLKLAVATAAAEPPPQQLPGQNRAVAAVVARILDAAL